MRVICALLTVWYSLRSANLFTPLGMVPVSGHAYVEEGFTDFDRGTYTFYRLRCERCGAVL